MISGDKEEEEETRHSAHTCPSPPLTPSHLPLPTPNSLTPTPPSPLPLPPLPPPSPARLGHGGSLGRRPVSSNNHLLLRPVNNLQRGRQEGEARFGRRRGWGPAVRAGAVQRGSPDGAQAAGGAAGRSFGQRTRRRRKCRRSRGESRGARCLLALERCSERGACVPRFEARMESRMCSRM
jgi:hypothetical protein